jgi:hypothetical protein
MPLGLLMLSRKWITHEQLTLALGRQRAAGNGRIGEWLVSTGAIGEETVARGVAAQWGLPVLLASDQSPEVSGLLPYLLTDAYKAIPVRIVARRILYLAVEQQVHSSLNRAIEKMTGFHVEPVILVPSVYERLARAARKSAFDSVPAHDRLFRTRSLKNLSCSILLLLDESPTCNVQIATIGKYVWVRLLRSGSNRLGEKVENILLTVTNADDSTDP